MEDGSVHVGVVMMVRVAVTVIVLLLSGCVCVSVTDRVVVKVTVSDCGLLKDVVEEARNVLDCVADNVAVRVAFTDKETVRTMVRVFEDAVGRSLTLVVRINEVERDMGKLPEVVPLPDGVNVGEDEWDRLCSISSVYDGVSVGDGTSVGLLDRGALKVGVTVSLGDLELDLTSDIEGEPDSDTVIVSRSEKV